MVFDGFWGYNLSIVQGVLWMDTLKDNYLNRFIEIAFSPLEGIDIVKMQ